MYTCAKAFKRTFLRFFYPAEHPPSPNCPSTNGDFPCRQPFFLSCVDDDDADDGDDDGGGGEGKGRMLTVIMMTVMTMVNAGRGEQGY